MARTVKNTKIDGRSARSKLPWRREPYWTVLSAGCAIGYRKGAKGGTWIARLRGDDGCITMRLERPTMRAMPMG